MVHSLRLRHVARLAPWLAVLALTMMIARPLPARAAHAAIGTTNNLTAAQRVKLFSIAYRTWKFFDADVDPTTHLPMDNIGFNGALAQGTYTSPTNIGVYLWSVVAARDLHLIPRPMAAARLSATLNTVERLTKWHGFLLSWYDTRNGNRIAGPDNMTSKEGTPLTGEFISTVDNAWYAAGLVVLRQAFPEFAARATALLNAMNFGIFYDNGDQSTNITAGQMYGGYNADQGPASFHYGVLDTETRIAAYIGIGTHTMPGAVWYRTWRTLPATSTAPPPGFTTSNFDWQGQYPPQGYYTTINDPQSGQPYTVFEGHYTYNGTQFVPSWGGSMFEALMPNLVVPETTWGPQSFGLNDKNYAQTQVTWATQGLGYPVWGLSPSSTPDDTGNYDAFGGVGPAYPNAISSNANCCAYSQYAVTPHASFLALDVLPQQAYANIQALQSRYPDLYGPYGFFDAVAPVATTYTMNNKQYTVRAGQVGHRYLVLDQAMIMAALDNAFNHGAMQRHFAADPVGQAAQPYLSTEQFSIH